MSKDAHATSKAAHKHLLQRRACFPTRHSFSGVGPRAPAWRRGERGACRSAL